MQDMIDQFYGGAEAQLGSLNTDALAMLERMYNQTAGEINTQSDAGRATIDETTQRALEALGGQGNPYAGLQMANAPAVSDPMAAYSQAAGAPQGGIQALQDMLQSQNATTGGGFNNLAQLLGASQQASQQSRIGDVNVARAGAQQDLSANQRAAALQALQQSTQARQAQQGTYMQQLLGLGQNRLQANLGAQQSTGDLLSQLQQSQLQAQLGQQSNTQGRQDQLMQQLLGLAGQGIDVYMMPVLQVIHQMTNTAVVHAIQIKHCRPVQSGDRTYSDGKSNFDNINHLRDLSIELINKHKGLFDETFMKRIIAVRYYRGISIFKKLKRVPGMLKNMYKEIVDMSYR